MSSVLRCTVITCAVLGLLAASPALAELQVGATAPNFTLPEWYTSTPTSLYDYAGKIILLDFFAYWCPHCQAALPAVQTQIDDYYEARGGNAAGLPVELISCNVVSTNRSATTAFVQSAKLETVLDDSARLAYPIFGNGYVPMFVLINGVAGANRAQWEVLYSDSGYSTAVGEQFRTIIDSVMVPEPGVAGLLALGILVIPKARRRG